MVKPLGPNRHKTYKPVAAGAKNHTEHGALYETRPASGSPPYLDEMMKTKQAEPSECLSAQLERIKGFEEWARSMCAQTCKDWPEGRHAPNCPVADLGIDKEKRND